MTTQIIVRLSNTLRNSIMSLRNLQKSTQDENDKIILSEALSQLIESQGFLSDIQLSYQKVLDENETSRKIIMQLEQRAEDLSKYEPFRLRSGCTVMVSKESNFSSYNEEWYCKHCSDNKKKSQLQPVFQSIEFVCTECGKTIWLTDEELEEVKGFYSPPSGR